MPDRKKIVISAGLLLVALWCGWWGQSLYELRLLGAEHTWIAIPAFGADFWSQTDFAARRWHEGVDPYANEQHLFHYPPIVIRLFFWTPYLTTEDALTVWIWALAIFVAVGTWWAWRNRSELGLRRWPLPNVLALVLFSFPVIFALERANFDLLTLVGVLGAMLLVSKDTPWAHALAGCALALGPWVKIYPGLIGVALVALRWWWALGGFVLAGVLVGAAAPEETIRSFEILQLAVERVKPIVQKADFFPWGHSLSVAWTKLVSTIDEESSLAALRAVPGMVAALAVLLPLVGWVCVRVFQSPNRDRVAYPLFLWVTAAGSFVPQIANDYSLVFLPLAAVAVWSRCDPWPVQACMLAFAVFWQPVAIPIDSWVLLGFKIAGLVGVGASIVLRAHSGADETPSGTSVRTTESPEHA